MNPYQSPLSPEQQHPKSRLIDWSLKTNLIRMGVADATADLHGAVTQTQRLTRMGMDLILIFDRTDTLLNDGFRTAISTECRLRVQQDYRLFDLLGNGPGEFAQVVLPKRPEGKRREICVTDDDGDGESTDMYGNPLTYVTAGELVGLPSDHLPWNRAIWAMLKALEPETLIVLWWC
jgi:hypothetical protein